MKHLDVSAITTTAEMPVKQGIWQHIQAAYGEAIGELGKALFGYNYDSSKIYILQGCVNSGSGINYVISAGSIFYNGEVYLVDATSFTISGSNIAECSLVISYYTGANADAVQFTDGSNHSIHQIIKCVIAPGLSGSGIGDFIGAINTSYIIQGGIGQTTEWTMPSGVVSDWFDSGTGNGLKFPVLGWTLDDQGYTIFGYKPGDADFGTLGATAGVKTVTLSAGNIPPLPITVPLYENGTVGSSNYPAVTDNNTVHVSDYTGTVNTGVTPAPFSTLPPRKVKLKITRYY